MKKKDEEEEEEHGTGSCDRGKSHFLHYHGDERKPEEEDSGAGDSLLERLGR